MKNPITSLHLPAVSVAPQHSSNHRVDAVQPYANFVECVKKEITLSRRHPTVADAIPLLRKLPAHPVKALAITFALQHVVPELLSSVTFYAPAARELRVVMEVDDVQ